MNVERYIKSFLPRGVGGALGLIFCIATLSCSGCKSSRPFTVAVIPQTTGTELWNPEQEGARIAAERAKARIYWNAPTREDDVDGQIALMNRVVDQRECDGIILAPDHALALITPVRHALAAGIPIIVVSSPLAIPAGPKLSYILNDDEEGGRLAAARVAHLLHGRGSVAVMGIDPSMSGVMTRMRSFETVLAAQYPRIRIVAKRMGSYNVPEEQQVADEILTSNMDLDAIVSLTSAATRGAYFAIADDSRAAVKLIGFDQDVALGSIQSGKLDSVVIQNTYEMGLRAVNLLMNEIHHDSKPTEVKLTPTLVTRDNLNTPEIQRVISLNWRLLQ